MVVIGEIIAIILHFISIICLLLVIYLTFHGNGLVSLFSIANMGQHLSKLFRLIFFGFEMAAAPLWACYVHAFTNFLTVGMESYISMVFTMRLWLMITNKNHFKLWLLTKVKYITYICGVVIPIILACFSIAPQLFQGRNFIIPSDAENCIAGYRTNTWQIFLSGMGTSFPPLIVSVFMGVHIFYVMCVVSTQTLMKDVKKFSTISYSSWIRMLWFAIFFSIIVSVNVIGDINNIRNKNKYGTPEPKPVLGIPYYLTACVGAGVLLIFGTTVEAKRKISSLLKKSISGFTSTLVNSSKKSQDRSGLYSVGTTSTYRKPDDVKLNLGSNFKSTGSIATGSIVTFEDTRTLKDMENKNIKKQNNEEYEATLEFNNFMKSLNGIKPELSDDDSGFTMNKNDEYSINSSINVNNRDISGLGYNDVTKERSNVIFKNPYEIPISQYANNKYPSDYQYPRGNVSSHRMLNVAGALGIRPNLNGNFNDYDSVLSNDFNNTKFKNDLQINEEEYSGKEDEDNLVTKKYNNINDPYYDRYNNMNPNNMNPTINMSPQMKSNPSIIPPSVSMGSLHSLNTSAGGGSLNRFNNLNPSSKSLNNSNKNININSEELPVTITKGSYKEEILYPAKVSYGKKVRNFSNNNINYL